MTFVYRPQHRRNATSHKDFGNVYIGISGKRNQQKLIYRNKSGEYASIHASYLTYEIHPEGTLTVVFHPFAGCIRPDENNNYLELVATSLNECIGTVEKILSENGISYTLPYLFRYRDLVDVIVNSPEEDDYLSRNSLYFFSPSYYFPISKYRGLWELKRAFIALYPILDAFITIAKGQYYSLETMLNKLIDYYFDQGWWFARRKEWKDENNAIVETQEDIVLPKLESYRFIRAGLWWEILARDQWTCCSCGRSSKEHGITLHVDPIAPRSMGGTDKKENLQTLCWKCNIGKSNRDMTDLRGKYDRLQQT